MWKRVFGCPCPVDASTIILGGSLCSEARAPMPMSPCPPMDSNWREWTIYLFNNKSGHKYEAISSSLDSMPATFVSMTPLGTTLLSAQTKSYSIAQADFVERKVKTPLVVSVKDDEVLAPVSHLLVETAEGCIIPGFKWMGYGWCYQWPGGPAFACSKCLALNARLHIKPAPGISFTCWHHPVILFDCFSVQGAVSKRCLISSDSLSRSRTYKVALLGLRPSIDSVPDCDMCVVPYTSLAMAEDYFPADKHLANLPFSQANINGRVVINGRSDFLDYFGGPVQLGYPQPSFAWNGSPLLPGACETSKGYAMCAFDSSLYYRWSLKWNCLLCKFTTLHTPFFIFVELPIIHLLSELVPADLFSIFLWYFVFFKVSLPKYSNSCEPNDDYKLWNEFPIRHKGYGEFIDNF